MPLKGGRDFGASQYYAAEVFGEQPKLSLPPQPLSPTPNESTFPSILARLKALTGFKPPIETPPSEVKPMPGDVLFDASLETHDLHSAKPTTDAKNES